MEKRLVLAIALSFVLLMSWSALTQKSRIAQNPQTYQQKAAELAEMKAGAKEAPLPAKQITPSLLFEYTLPHGKLIFSEPQAAIKEITFYNYQFYILSLKNSLLYGFDDTVFERQIVENKEVMYLHADQEKRITKSFIFSENSYAFDLKIDIENISGAPLKIKFPINLATLDFSVNDRMQFHGVTVSDGQKVTYPNPKKSATFDSVRFLSVRDRYFCAIIQPEQQGFSGYINKVSQNEFEVGLFSPELTIEPGKSIQQAFRVFLGPQDSKMLAKLDRDWPAIIYFGKLDLIGQGLLKLLEFFYSLVRNWGWAVIMLSFAIYIILYPLTLKQMKSMKEMQVLQPQIERLRQQHKDNPQRLNKEILELYKEHKVNPMGGCLPMVLQIPIFFALYQVLSRAIALKGADFLWIKDLSEPDRLFMFAANIPLLGNEFNILPVLMAIGMFVQQKFSMQSMSGPQAEQQKMLTVIMPVLFGVLFYRMPSGLVLYWFVNSTLTLIYQIRVAKAK